MEGVQNNQSELLDEGRDDTLRVQDDFFTSQTMENKEDDRSDRTKWDTTYLCLKPGQIILWYRPIFKNGRRWRQRETPTACIITKQLSNFFIAIPIKDDPRYGVIEFNRDDINYFATNVFTRHLKQDLLKGYQMDTLTIDTFQLAYCFKIFQTKTCVLGDQCKNVVKGHLVNYKH